MRAENRICSLENCLVLASWGVLADYSGSGAPGYDQVLRGC